MTPIVLGTEVEYGIFKPGVYTQNPQLYSNEVVQSYASGPDTPALDTWNYAAEQPRNDIRNNPDLINSAESTALRYPGVANTVTNSGARYYVDHAHPEYASPENTSAFDAICWEKAGDEILMRSAEQVNMVSESTQVQIYKNNVDGKGASYGTHENYLFPRSFDPHLLYPILTTHFVTRSVYTGAGRVGLGVYGEKPGYQISQRADYIETDISLETTLNRGIINTRDEPHAHSQWRRIHVITGDATMSETASVLKVGTTALILKSLLAGADFSELCLVQPVQDFKRVSYDLSCTETLELRSGDNLSAVDIQKKIKDIIQKNSEETGLDSAERSLLSLWGDTLDDLEKDPLLTQDRLDWTAKLALLQSEEGKKFNTPKSKMVDLQYHLLNREKGLYYALVHHGAMKTLIPAQRIEQSITLPPLSTRAWVRGRIIDRFKQDVYAVNWDSLILNTPHEGKNLTRILMDNPLEFTGTECCAATEESEDIAECVAVLSSLYPNKVLGYTN